MDTSSPEKRSWIMAQVRAKGNKRTEVRVVELLRRLKIHGWRRQFPIYGKPDFVFGSRRVAIFVDGCFWHGCRSCYRRPPSHTKYWDSKLARNQARDRKVNRELRRRGWHVLRIRECSLSANPGRCVRRIERALGEP